MPNVKSEDIQRIAYGLLRAAGTPDDHANTVASHLANANLAGHDSHGFIRIIQYMREIKEGSLDPKARPEVVKEGKGTAQVNGNFTFGQVVATFATRVATQKAREYGISLVAMRDLRHTGRIGAYTEMAAGEGMASIMFSGHVGGEVGSGVAPFGGSERRMGTNPISMAFPFSSEGPVLLDFATSMAAEGKLRVYRARGDSLPSAWVLNKEGVPSTDPNDYYSGGALLPMGGLDGGHKGYSLSVMVSLFGAILAGGWPPDDGGGAGWDGSSIIVVDIGEMAPVDGVRTQVAEMVRYIKDTPAMKGSGGVLYPGEIEARNRQERLANGVSVEQATWDQVVSLVDEHGLREELGIGG